MQQHPDALSLDRLLGALPELPELAALRDALLAVSTPDPAHAWSSASRYVTFDKRVVSREAVESAIGRSRLEAHARTDRLYGAVEALLGALASGNAAASVERLLELAEWAEGQGAWQQAATCARLAVIGASEQRDAGLTALALRRQARVQLAQGELGEAQRLYRQSAGHAAAVEDRAAEAIAWIGAGNACALQGCWPEARERYEAALPLTGPTDRLRAQVLINLAMVAHEEALLEEATSWLAQAEALAGTWSDADRSGWCNAAGQVQLSMGALERARALFEEALHHAATGFDRAMVLDNLSEEALCRGAIEEAEAWARRAEQQALSASSPRALAEVYLRLGRISSARFDANGVTFFEKALELCRTQSFTALEARVCCDYGTFRAALGDHDEARSYLERGRMLFDRIGALAAASAAVSALAALGIPAPPVPPA